MYFLIFLPKLKEKQIELSYSLLEKYKGEEQNEEILIKFVRKACCRENNAPILQIVNIGFIEKLTEYLKSSNENILGDVLWSLVNISEFNNDYAIKMKNLGIHHIILHVTINKCCNNANLLDDCLTVIGNICASCIQARDDLILEEVQKYISNLWHLKELPRKIFITSCWLASNLCRGFPTPPIVKIQELLIGFNELLKFSYSENEIQADILQALSELTYKNDENLNFLFNIIQYDGILYQLGNPDENLQDFALVCIGNICMSTNVDFIDIILKQGTLEHIFKLLNISNWGSRLIKDICWIITNIAHGPIEHIIQIIEKGIAKIICSIIRAEVPGSVFYNQKIKNR